MLHREILEKILEELNYTYEHGWSVGQVEAVNLIDSTNYSLSNGLTILVSSLKTKDIHYYLTLKGLWFRFLANKGLIILP
jgi:hypothetical protein